LLSINIEIYCIQIFGNIYCFLPNISIHTGDQIYWNNYTWAAEGLKVAERNGTGMERKGDRREVLEWNEGEMSEAAFRTGGAAMSGNRQKTKGMTDCPDKIKEPRIKNQDKGNLWRHSLFYTKK
jgi:hypothetical protein